MKLRLSYQYVIFLAFYVTEVLSTITLYTVVSQSSEIIVASTVSIMIGGLSITFIVLTMGYLLASSRHKNIMYRAELKKTANIFSILAIGLSFVVTLYPIARIESEHNFDPLVTISISILAYFFYLLALQLNGQDSAKLRATGLVATAGVLVLSIAFMWLGLSSPTIQLATYGLLMPAITLLITGYYRRMVSLRALSYVSLIVGYFIAVIVSSVLIEGYPYVKRELYQGLRIVLLLALLVIFYGYQTTRKVSELAFRLISTDVALLKVRSGIIVEANKNSEELLRLPSSKLLGTNIRDLFIETHKQPGDLISIESGVYTVRGTGVQVRYSPLLASTFSDITQLIMLLDASKSPADFAEPPGFNKQMLEFTSLVVHELKTPLAIADGYMKLMEDNPSPVFATKARAAIHRTNMILANLREKYVSSSKYTSLNLSSLDASTLICSLAEDFQATLLNDEDKMYCNAAPCNVRWDAPLIQQALTAILSNAVKYKRRDTPLELSIEGKASKLAKEYNIIISDNGIGFPKEELDRIMEGQRRAKNIVSLPGTGLGLSLVFSIIRAHQGRVQISSKGQGKGTTVELVLPFTPQ